MEDKPHRLLFLICQRAPEPFGWSKSEMLQPYPAGGKLEDPHCGNHEIQLKPLQSAEEFEAIENNRAHDAFKQIVAQGRSPDCRER